MGFVLWIHLQSKYSVDHDTPLRPASTTPNTGIKVDTSIGIPASTSQAVAAFVPGAVLHLGELGVLTEMVQSLEESCVELVVINIS